eukprot:4960609-Pleurochrysis_carterae.AAC.1
MQSGTARGPMGWQRERILASCRQKKEADSSVKQGRGHFLEHGPQFTAARKRTQPYAKEKVAAANFSTSCTSALKPFYARAALPHILNPTAAIAPRMPVCCDNQNVKRTASPSAVKSGRLELSGKGSDLNTLRILHTRICKCPVNHHLPG